MKIAIAPDHGGFSLKAELVEPLRQANHEPIDLGAHDYVAGDDYPDYAYLVGQAVQIGQAERGIVLCGSGVGACIAAKKMRGVRAGLCHDTYSAHQGVEHDDMNVLCLGARIIGVEPAKEIVLAYVNARSNTDERFQRRLNKVLKIERDAVRVETERRGDLSARRFHSAGEASRALQREVDRGVAGSDPLALAHREPASADGDQLECTLAEADHTVATIGLGLGATRLHVPGFVLPERQDFRSFNRGPGSVDDAAGDAPALTDNDRAQIRRLPGSKLDVHSLHVTTFAGVEPDREDAGPEMDNPVLAVLAFVDLVRISGAGHYVKMIHNGIEYGMMQALAEGFSILKARDEFNLDLHDIARIWQRGSVVRSWLLDLAERALESDPTLADIKPWVADSGEGRWTVFESIDMAVPAPIITLALQMRFASRDGENYTARMLAALRNQFGGHAVKKEIDPPHT